MLCGQSSVCWHTTKKGNFQGATRGPRRQAIETQGVVSSAIETAWTDGSSSEWAMFELIKVTSTVLSTVGPAVGRPRPVGSSFDWWKHED